MKMVSMTLVQFTDSSVKLRVLVVWLTAGLSGRAISASLRARLLQEVHEDVDD